MAAEGNGAGPLSPHEHRTQRASHVWSLEAIEDIQRKAQLGRYVMGAFSTTRRLPSFDDLTFIPCTLSRVPLEGYRERCETTTVLGTRCARPLELDTPVMISGMSFGALSANAKEALGRAASTVGTSTTTGDGGMHPRERAASTKLVYQVTPSHYGNNPHHMQQADAVEVVIGQGAKPGTGGVLLGFKVSEEVARMRDLPLGVDQRSPVRHPDFVGADDLRLKIEELREAIGVEPADEIVEIAGVPRASEAKELFDGLFESAWKKVA